MDFVRPSSWHYSLLPSVVWPPIETDLTHASIKQQSTTQNSWIPSSWGAFYDIGPLAFAIVFLLCLAVFGIIGKSLKAGSAQWTWNASLVLVVQATIMSTVGAELAFIPRHLRDLASASPKIHTLVGIILGSACAIWTVARVHTSTLRGIYHLSTAVVWSTAVATGSTSFSSSTGRQFPLLLGSLFWLAFVLDLMAPVEHKTQGLSSNGASFFQLLSFTWLNRVIRKAGTNVLVMKDLWIVNDATSVQQSLDVLLKKGLQDATRQPTSFLSFMLRTYPSLALGTMALELVPTVGGLAQPLLLKEFLRKPSVEVVLLMWIVKMICSVATSHELFLLKLLAVKLKSGLTSAVYETTLDMAPVARQAAPTAVNLVEADTQRVQDFVASIHSIWSLPLQCVLTLACLGGILGWKAVMISCMVVCAGYPLMHRESSKMQQGMRHLMARKDARTTLTTEVLDKIHSIKLYGWQDIFQNRLNKARAHELAAVGVLALVQSIVMAIVGAVPETMAAVAFFVILTSRGALVPEVVFPSLGFFIMTKTSVSSFSGILPQFFACETSFHRIQEYLAIPKSERMAALTVRRPTNSPGLVAQGVTFGRSGKIIVSDMSLDLAPRSLVVLSGPSGCGKSSVLQGLMGFLEPLAGEILVHGSTAYMPQTPWLTHGTIRDNILFGRPLDAEFYQTVLRACDLTTDLASLPKTDETDLAGVSATLSGGQMNRISLARAIYGRPNILFLDDPLGALDGSVKMHISHHVFGPTGLLANAICIATTSCTTLLRVATKHYTLKEGRLVEAPMLETLHDGNHSPDRSASKISGTVVTETMLDEETSRFDETSVPPPLLGVSESETPHDIEAPDVNPEKSTDKSGQGPRRWSLAPYRTWLRMVNPLGWVVVACLIAATKALGGFSTFTLKELTQHTGPEAFRDLAIFTLIGMVQVACNALFVFAAYVFCLIPAAHRMHGKLLHSVINAPMRYFATTPAGDILNHFTNDINKLDGSLTGNFLALLMIGANLLLVFSVLVISSPLTIVFIILLGAGFYLLQSNYLAIACQLRRMELTTRGPVIGSVREACAGYQSILANGRRNFVLGQHYKQVNNSISVMVPLAGLEAWLLLRLDLMGSLLQAFTALVLLWLQTNQGQLGFVMTYVMQVTTMLQGLVRFSTNLEMDIISVQRIQECLDLEDESQLSALAGVDPGSTWPEHGAISFQDLSAAYGPEDELCLSGINLDVKPGQKIAIVGRTGAGKSSMGLAVLGGLHIAGGSLAIDDINVSSVDIRTLRSRIACVPQNAPIFTGTLRSNLDPAGALDDSKLRQVIRASGLESILQTSEDILDIEIDAHSHTLSKGQIQLVAVARAMTLDPKVLILDEATESIDSETAGMFHAVLSSELSECTTLAIVHRLDRILEYDRVAVLGQGTVIAFGSPVDLLNNPDSPLARLAENSISMDESL